MLEMERDAAASVRTAEEGQVAALEADVERLKGEVAMLSMLMGRADISPADLADLQAELTRLTDEKAAAESARQARLDAQADAGLGDGLARTIVAPVYTTSDADTLANLLRGGQTAFAPLSASVHRALWASLLNHGVAYLKAIASDGEGGFNAAWTIDGVEIPVH